VFFYASKIVWFFATPSNLLVSLILLGLLLALLPRLRRFGTGLALVFTLATVAFGILPLASYIMVPLEARFPRFQDDGRPVDGIILLGGAVDSAVSHIRGELVVNESAERILDTIALAHRYPAARILIVGGGNTILGYRVAESPLVASYFKDIGIDPARILLEDRSRTTYENAVFSAEVAKPREGERWLLVTSAWHMPRAVGVFEKAGFPVVPYPIDSRTGGQWKLRPFGAISEGLRRLDVGVKEWAGLVAYYLTGRSSALFPAPQPSEGGSASR